MIIESPLDLIFRDLFYRVPTFAGTNDVFLKLEGFNVTGSIKIKTAIALVEDLEQRGLAKTDETVIVESSSGNLGLALSLVCAAKTLQICLRDRPECQSCHHTGDGALWGKGNRRGRAGRCGWVPGKQVEENQPYPELESKCRLA